MKNKILSLCDYTGNALKPWADAGYECIAVDTKHSIRRDKKKGGIDYVWGDVRSWWPESISEIAGVFAFPPCTHLAASGARDWSNKGLTLFIDALMIVESCRRICAAVAADGGWGVLENPVSRLSTAWRKPDFTFDPNEYAGYLDNPADEAYTKKTCLWLFGAVDMPRKKHVAPVLGSKMHTLSGGPSPEKTLIRNATPMGFSIAFHKANDLRESPRRRNLSRRVSS